MYFIKRPILGVHGVELFKGSSGASSQSAEIDKVRAILRIGCRLIELKDLELLS